MTRGHAAHRTLSHTGWSRGGNAWRQTHRAPLTFKRVGALTRRVPRFTTWLFVGNTTPIIRRYVHIHLALETQNGLLASILCDADRKRLWAIAAEVEDLASRARKISSEEMGGAGGEAFSPRVTLPEVVILDHSRMKIVPVWESGEWMPAPKSHPALPYDYRLVNGPETPNFMSC
jgi:pyruvate dehydrogenase E2 component (dihydrolipoamide acetyltransferase)